MRDDTKPPESFPQYPAAPQPNPQGVPVADPKFHKPLYKLMNSMFKLRRAPKISRRPHGRMKKVKFY